VAPSCWRASRTPIKLASRAILRRGCVRHCKLIGYNAAAVPLLRKAETEEGDLDPGMMALALEGDSAEFVERCGQLCYSDRELTHGLDAAVFLAPAG